MIDMESAFSKAVEASKEFGPRITVNVEYGIRRHSSSETREWSVFFSDGKRSGVCYNHDFDEAVAGVVRKMNAAPVVCDICGGKNSGEFKHSHAVQA